MDIIIEGTGARKWGSDAVICWKTKGTVHSQKRILMTKRG